MNFFACYLDMLTSFQRLVDYVPLNQRLVLILCRFSELVRYLRKNKLVGRGLTYSVVALQDVQQLLSFVVELIRYTSNIEKGLMKQKTALI